MTRQWYEELAKEFQEAEQVILSNKRHEYSPNYDVLENFKQISDFVGIPKEQVALVYLLKHIQSIAMAIRGYEKYNWTWATKDGEGLKQRIADARNYLLLLAACIEEETKEVNNDAEKGSSNSMD